MAVRGSLFDRLPPRQRDVLGFIAINWDKGHRPATIKALLRKGLIEEAGEEELRFKDGLPPMRIMHYAVPLDVHIAWCEWCNEWCDAQGEQKEEGNGGNESGDGGV